MANTSIRQQIETLSIHYYKSVSSDKIELAPESVDTIMAIFANNYTATADVAELVRAAKLEAYVHGLYTGAMPKAFAEPIAKDYIAELQPPHKAEQ